MEFLTGLFEDKILTDTRNPIQTFSLPGHDEEFGLFAPDAEIWKQLIYYVALQIPIQCAFAAIIYIFIVKNRKTTQAYLIGWGLIIPLSCILPFYILEFLDIRNKVVKLAGGNLMSIVAFKCIEAMFGTPPSPVVEVSISNYMAYYSTLVPFVWDEKILGRKRVTAAEIFRTIFWLLFVFHVYSLFLSFMVYHDFKPFANDTVELEQVHLNLDLFTPQHLANGYLLSVMTFLHLALVFGVNALASKAQGYSTRPIFLNPLFASRSPTEFWTKRWNVMIHQMLKYGAFLPAKKLLNPTISVLVAFVASGLFHDYAWVLDFYHTDYYYDTNGICQGCYAPIFGRLTVFFLFTGLIMLLERPVSKLPFVISLSRILPTFAISTMLVLIHVPFSHWYYGDWVKAGFFHEFTLALWHIRKL